MREGKGWFWNVFIVARSGVNSSLHVSSITARNDYSGLLPNPEGRQNGKRMKGSFLPSRIFSFSSLSLTSTASTAALFSSILSNLDPCISYKSLKKSSKTLCSNASGLSCIPKDSFSPFNPWRKKKRREREWRKEWKSKKFAYQVKLIAVQFFPFPLSLNSFSLQLPHPKRERELMPLQRSVGARSDFHGPSSLMK